MIYTFIPYAPDEQNIDLGAAYNHFMSLLPSDDDWACFLDHDAMFTTRDWYHQLSRIVAGNPGAGCFTAVTNRVGNPWQVHGYDFALLEQYPDRVRGHFAILDRDHVNHDVAHHRRIGKDLRDRLDDQVVLLGDKPPMSGVLILTQKKAWRDVGFASGFIGVDWKYHRGCLAKGYPVFLMAGVYVYHWYRGDGDISHVEPFFWQSQSHSST